MQSPCQTPASGIIATAAGHDDLFVLLDDEAVSHTEPFTLANIFHDSPDSLASLLELGVGKILELVDWHSDRGRDEGGPKGGY